LDPTYDLAQNFIDIKYKDLPLDVIKTAKYQILDTLGVALGGSKTEGVQELIKLLKSFGGKRQSSVFVGDAKLPVFHAAQINASMSHALDYDDGQVRAVIHPGCVIIPTVLAVAEYVGKISGKECITAIVLAGDLMARMGMAAKYEKGIRTAGWHGTPLYGVFAAAGITGKFLNFNQVQMINAFGLAYHQAAGNLQCTIEGSLAKRMGAGMAVRDGIMSALMAQLDITGPTECIEGKNGLYNQYHRGGYDRQALMQNLGKVFEGADLTVKPYPCCRITHANIDAALELVNEHDIKPDQVKEIVVSGGRAKYNLMTPIEAQSKPANIVSAQFSIPWVVATAIAHRKVTMADFTEEAIKDKDVLMMASKIKAELAPDLITPGIEPGRVKIVTSKGTFNKQVDLPYGDPKNPMPAKVITDKFIDCVKYSIKPIAQNDIIKIIKLIEKFEELEDVKDLIKLVS
jgi:2-methylcitrate dehydratase PrpD